MALTSNDFTSGSFTGGYLYPGTQKYLDLGPGSSVTIRAPRLKPEFPGLKYFAVGSTVYKVAGGDSSGVYHASFGDRAEALTYAKEKNG